MSIDKLMRETHKQPPQNNFRTKTALAVIGFSALALFGPEACENYRVANTPLPEPTQQEVQPLYDKPVFDGSYDVKPIVQKPDF